MKFKDLRIVILDTKDERINEFNTRSEKYDEHEVSLIKRNGKWIFVVLD